MDKTESGILEGDKSLVFHSPMGNTVSTAGTWFGCKQFCIEINFSGEPLRKQFDLTVSEHIFLAIWKTFLKVSKAVFNV